MARVKIPTAITTELLTSCARRCCLCFGLHNDLREKQGQIAHLDKNPNNHAITNLAFLCLEHHNAYDSITSQSKGITIGEVRQYRKELLDLLAKSRERPAEIPETCGEQVKTNFDKHLKLASQLTLITDRDRVYRQLVTFAIAHHEYEQALEIATRLTLIADQDKIVKEIIKCYCKDRKFDDAEELTVNLHPKLHHQPPVFASKIAPRVTLFPADEMAGVKRSDRRGFIECNSALAWTRQAVDPRDFKTNRAVPPHHSQVLGQRSCRTEVSAEAVRQQA